MELFKQQSIQKKSNRTNYSRNKINIEERAERVLQDMDVFYTAKKYDVTTKYTYDQIKDKKIVYKLHRAKKASECGENTFISVKHEVLDNYGYYRLGWDFIIEEKRYNNLKYPLIGNEKKRDEK